MREKKNITKLPVFGGLVEEATVDLRLLVLQGHVHGQDVAIFQPQNSIKLVLF